MLCDFVISISICNWNKLSAGNIYLQSLRTGCSTDSGPPCWWQLTFARENMPSSQHFVSFRHLPAASRPVQHGAVHIEHARLPFPLSGHLQAAKENERPFASESPPPVSRHCSGKVRRMHHRTCHRSKSPGPDPIKFNDWFVFSLTGFRPDHKEPYQRTNNIDGSSRIVSSR